MRDILDLGHGHTFMWVQWDPDLDLNPQYTHLADRLPVKHFMAVVSHTASDGTACESAVTIDTDIAREAGYGDRALWQLQSEDPLTITPSLLCGRCGDHGFITEGRWMPA